MRTAFLMTALTVLLVLVGDYFGGARGMMMMLIISLAMNLFSYWNSDKLVLAQYNACLLYTSPVITKHGCRILNLRLKKKLVSKH